MAQTAQVPFSENSSSVVGWLLERDPWVDRESVVQTTESIHQKPGRRSWELGRIGLSLAAHVIHISTFARTGLPDQIVSDSRPKFTSKTFRKFSNANWIKYVTGAPHHSSTNDQAERLVQSFKEGIKADKSGRIFQHKLHRLLLTYRSAPHATTALSPAQLLLGRNVRTRLDLIKPDDTRGVDKKLLQSNNSTLKFFVNDQYVWVCNYRRGPNWVRGTVIERTGPVLFRVKVNDQTWRRHVEQLRDSYLNPAIEETAGERVVPGRGGEGHVMPAVSETKQKDTPTQVITLDGEVHSGPKIQQPSPEPEFITTRVRPPARFQDFVRN